MSRAYAQARRRLALALFQDTADAEHWYEALPWRLAALPAAGRRPGTAADEITSTARCFLDPVTVVRRMIARGEMNISGGIGTDEARLPGYYHLRTRSSFRPLRANTRRVACTRYRRRSDNPAWSWPYGWPTATYLMTPHRLGRTGAMVG
jgi:hypothetical protein